MKKRILSTILALTAALSCLSFSVSAEGAIRVFINHVRVQFDVEPQIINDRTMVPLRAIFEAMGATVLWNAETRTVTAIKGAHTVITTVGNTTMYVNEKAVTMDVSPQIVNDRTLVPARFVAEAFDCTVEWIENTRSVAITTKPADKTEEKSQDCYPDTDVPTYTSVTNMEVIGQAALENGLPVYQYQYTSDADFQAYTDVLAADDWTVSTKDDPATKNIYEFMVEKGDKYVIAYIFRDLKQVWIVCG